LRDVCGRARVVAPLRIQTQGAVATEVAWVAPKLAIDVEIVAREDVARERDDPFRHGAVLRGGRVDAVKRHARPDPLGLVRHRPPAADARLRRSERPETCGAAEPENNDSPTEEPLIVRLGEPPHPLPLLA